MESGQFEVQDKWNFKKHLGEALSLEDSFKTIDRYNII